jgi:hypothetical protein
MEHQIGEIFEYNGEWYQCIRDITCINCGFNNKGCLADRHITGDCSGRLDGASVVFKKLEKVGEPYIFSNMEIHNITMQRYKVFVKPIFTNNSIITTYNMVNETISIEIKNKEDMEEKKDNYDGNMDKECIQICDVLNSISDVCTTESCCGHCKDRFMIFFTCDNPHSLAIIARVFDRRYIGTSQPWHIELQTKDSGAYDYFIHSETKYSSEEVMMKDVNKIIENIKYWCDDKFTSHFKGCDDKPTLTPFDINSAKQGKPVCTRDGRKARIICFDRINGDYYKIVACVTAFDGDFEEVLFYGIDGYIVDSQNPKDEDLMMLPEKKEGWVNVYREETNNNERLIEQTIYKTRKDAFDNACPKGYITTTKINWEE